MLVVPARDHDPAGLGRVRAVELRVVEQGRQRLAVATGFAAVAVEQPTVDGAACPGVRLEGQAGRAEHQAVAGEERGGDAELGQAAQELAGAVERVDDPGRLAVDEGGRLLRLLGEPVRAGDQR